MQIWFRFGSVAIACGLFGGGPAGSLAYGMSPDVATTACERAGVAAEQASGLPAGILLAIGRVESGRWDTARGRLAAWPFTINAAGKGEWFETEAAATAAVQSLLDAGTRSIDVGCFQINLMWHPEAFANLGQAFDPGANARYAASFLLSLFSRTGSWEAAVASYHSADPSLGFAYRQQVYASWLTEAPVSLTVRAGPVPPPMPKLVTAPYVYAGVTVWSPPADATPGEVVAMPGASAATPSLAAAPLPIISYQMPRGFMPHH